LEKRPKTRLFKTGPFETALKYFFVRQNSQMSIRPLPGFVKFSEWAGPMPPFFRETEPFPKTEVLGKPQK
jgi:hypothetical protein